MRTAYHPRRRFNLRHDATSSIHRLASTRRTLRRHCPHVPDDLLERAAGDRALPLEVHIPALPCRGGAALAERLFAPLGWSVAATPVPADPEVPRWGDSRYVDLRLSGELRLASALHHLYVLLPVLDDAKHYWFGNDEVDKLIRAGEGWLQTHPERDVISRRYLAHRRSLVTTAVGRLAELDDTAAEALDDAVGDRRPHTAHATLTVIDECGTVIRIDELRCDRGGEHGGSRGLLRRGLLLTVLHAGAVRGGPGARRGAAGICLPKGAVGRQPPGA